MSLDGRRDHQITSCKPENCKITSQAVRACATMEIAGAHVLHKKNRENSVTSRQNPLPILAISTLLSTHNPKQQFPTIKLESPVQEQVSNALISGHGTATSNS
jgi:hypothetical protein